MLFVLYRNIRSGINYDHYPMFDRVKCKRKRIAVSPTLRCVLQLRISCPQWAVFNGVKGQTSVIVQSDPSISISGSLLLGER